MSRDGNLQQLRIQRIQSALNKSGSYYQQRQLELALEAGQQALDEAKQLGLANITAHCQYNMGNILMQLGRLQRALIAFAWIFSKSNMVEQNQKYMDALIRYAEIAQQVPLSLKSIEDVYIMAEETIKSDFKHEVLVMRAQCARFRGLYADALNYSQQAWDLKQLKFGGSGQVDDFHLDGLISAALELGQIDLAKQYMEEWNTRLNVMPKNRLVRQNRCRAEIALADANPSLAIEYGNRALDYAKQSDYQETLAASYMTLGKIYFETKMLDEMRQIICEMLSLRRVERSYIRYQLVLLMANYHQLEFKKNQSDCTKNKALRLYHKAERIGRNIDEALETALYFQMVQDQIQRIS